MPYPVATMPPIKGEISMAPIITATLFKLSPIHAIIMAMTKIIRLVPSIEASDIIRWLMTSIDAASPFKSNKLFHGIIFPPCPELIVFRIYIL